MAAGVVEPEAMALATATPTAMPSVRFVLLKGIDERGVEFFTNYESRKGRELIANPRAALAVLWKPLQRQVRLEGPVEVLDAGGVRRLLRDPLARLAARRLGVAPVRGDPGPRMARGAPGARSTRSTRTRSRARRTGAASGCVPHGDRVLGGPPEPPPRPRGVHPRRGRRVGQRRGYRPRADRRSSRRRSRRRRSTACAAPLHVLVAGVVGAARRSGRRRAGGR